MVSQVNELQVAALFGRWRHRCGPGPHWQSQCRFCCSGGSLPHLLIKGSTVTAKQSNLNCRLVSLFVAATAECHPVRLPAQQDTLARSSLFLRRPHLTPSDVLELGQKSGECKEMFRQVENSRRNRRKIISKKP
mmetsp:Transcript_23500/g.33643  ORF Transcript_23500/g.33643 Transcript_23500/m.33643 type:complete len:134 (+) Transcript_23500:64-465(+)